MKSLCIAFSMFSKLPVPQFEWKEKDMKYMLLYFPLVGVMIGAAAWLWYWLCVSFEINELCYVLVGTAIPVLISGGIHIDGYMDTMDALHSYQSRERKLEILKDAHIGAFAVIQLILYFMIYAGAYAVIGGKTAVLLLGTGYWLSRILSAVGTVSLPCAKKDGLMFQFSSQSDRKKVKLVLYLQLAVCGALLVCLSLLTGLLILAASLLAFWYYRRKSIKEFGGITGDLSGYYTTLCEGVIAVTAAAACIAGWI